jgi:tetratricopeptide (TPR) repeat protein
LEAKLPNSVALVFALAGACLLFPRFALADEIDICASAPAKGALKACSALIAKGGRPVDLAVYHFNKGIALDSNGKINAALSEYNKAIELNPLYSAPHNNKALILDRQRKHKLAKESFDLAVKLDPDNFYALNSRGRHSLVVLKNPKLALDDFNRALQLNPNFVVAYANRGFAYQELGRKPEAIVDLKKALSLGATPQQAKIIKKTLKRLGN